MGCRNLPDMYAQTRGAQRLRVSADISGKFLPHMLHMLCNTYFWHSEKLLNLLFTVLPLYVMMGAVYGYGF